MQWNVFSATANSGGQNTYDYEALAHESFKNPLVITQCDPLQANLKSSDWFCANVLWPLLHGLAVPELDLTALHLHWEDLQDTTRHLVNSALASPSDGILINDFQLAPAARILSESGFNGPIAFFLHTPWPTATNADEISVLLMTKLASEIANADIVYFQTSSHLANFKALMVSQLGAEATDDGIKLVSELGIARTLLKVQPVSVDPIRLNEMPFEVDPDLDPSDLLFVHVARSDPSKNTLNTIKAFASFVKSQTYVSRQIFLDLHIVPSRQEWGIYQVLLAEILHTVQQLNLELAPIQEQAIRLHTSNNYASALGSLRRFDVLLAPSHADGMNLVIKEASALNTKSGFVVATHKVGAMSELAQHCLLAANGSEHAILAAIQEGFQLPDQVRTRMAVARSEAVRSNDSAKWATGVVEAIRDLHDSKLLATSSRPVAPRL